MRNQEACVNEPVVVACGQTEYHKSPDEPTLWYIADAVRRALASCGLSPTDVDGFGVSSFLLPPDNTATVAEQLGITAKWSYWGTSGGSAQVAGLLQAAHAIERGDAEVVVLAAADAYSVRRHNALMDSFNTGMRDYLAPYGFGGTNGLFAMLQRRHAYEFGTTREQLGKLAVTQRANAVKNSNALLRQPMTLTDYMDARTICAPLGLYDCVLPCGGGEAVVLTSRRKAEGLGRAALRIRAGAERMNYAPEELLMLEAGWAEFQESMFAAAGITHSDVDMLQCYDDYPIMELIQIESLGFCERGEGGQFLADTDISIDGELPINTGGGQLSCGQSGMGGGAIGLTEAVLQLQHEAGERQVPDARTALVSGFGMVGYGRGLCQSAVLLTRD